MKTRLDLGLSLGKHRRNPLPSAAKITVAPDVTKDQTSGKDGVEKVETLLKLEASLATEVGLEDGLAPKDSDERIPSIHLLPAGLPMCGPGVIEPSRLNGEEETAPVEVLSENVTGREDGDKEAGMAESEKSESESRGEEVGGELSYKRCLVCRRECLRRIKRCKTCKGGLYCSKACRENHVEDHKELCDNIMKLEEMEAQKRILSTFSVREQNQVRAKVKDRLIQLVGEKPVLNCQINGNDIDALWDTGSMIAMGEEDWVKEIAPEAKIMTVEEFLEGDSLHLYAANNTKVDVVGVVELEIALGSYKVLVPFLVTRQKLNSPIIGYNVIKHLVQMDIKELPKLLRNSLPLLTAT